ncbi:cell filamentation protein Fic [Clostridium botulinum]|nr:cell filamentation protein Fic [Clostridium botulinum]
MDNSKGNIIFYTNESGNVNIEVLFGEENVWLPLAQIVDLFERDKSTISRHIKNIFEEKELEKKEVVNTIPTIATDGKTYNVDYYNLDLIIAVGYRVKSNQGIQFRKWATNVLKEFVVKGFVLDDNRLKNGSNFGKDYFDELLERIREIRASERRFYQKITDIYKECSIDYSKDSEVTKKFYAEVQNKLHWAITGKTAAEIIVNRADAKKSHMGLTTWKHAPEGKILKSDVKVAKNYLKEDEISELNRLVNMFLDYAENQAKKQIPMKMVDWIKKLNAFLEFNEYKVLNTLGIISKEKADKKAIQEYTIFRVEQDKAFKSDFDKLINSSKNLKNHKS